MDNTNYTTEHRKASVYLTMPQKMSAPSPTVSTVCRERFWDTKPLKSCSTTISTAFTPLDTNLAPLSVASSTRGFAPPSGNQRCSTLVRYIFENYCNLILQHDEKIAMQFDRQIVISDGKLLSDSVDKT